MFYSIKYNYTQKKMALANHGNVIGTIDLPKIGDRSRFLRAEYVEKVASNIAKGLPLNILPYDAANTAKYGAKFAYFITVHGVLEDGSKARVTLTGIRPSFDILYEPRFARKGIDIDAFVTSIGNAVTETNPKIRRGLQLRVHDAKLFNKFQEDQNTFVELSFNSLTDRQEILDLFRETGYVVCSDDNKSNYLRKLCRDRAINYAAPCELTNYVVTETHKSTEGVAYYREIEVNVANYRQLDEPPESLVNSPPLLAAAFDAEMFSDSGNFPRADRANDYVAIIGLSIGYVGAEDTLNIGIYVPSARARGAVHANASQLYIEAANESSVLGAFAYVLIRYKPDLITAFNGGEFDWPYIVTRWRKYSQFSPICQQLSTSELWKTDDASIMSMYFRPEKIKIEAQRFVRSQELQLPGLLSFDTRNEYRKLYPKDERSSLNYFLKMNNQPLKRDMPIHKLFDILRDGDGAHFALAVDYCVIDAKRTFQLMNIRNIVGENIQRAAITRTTLRDSFFRANGVRVRNMVVGRGQELGYRFEVEKRAKAGEQFVGAFVMTPKTGLYTSRLTVRERIAHRARYADASPHKIECVDDADITQLQHAVVARLVARFYADIAALNETNTQFPDVIRAEFAEAVAKLNADSIADSAANTLADKIAADIYETPHPIGAVDVESLYPSIIQALCISPDAMIGDENEMARLEAKGHVLHHVRFSYCNENVHVAYVRENIAKNEATTVYGRILFELFRDRKRLKTRLESCKVERDALIKQRTEIGAQIADFDAIANVSKTDSEIGYVSDEDDTKFYPRELTDEDGDEAELSDSESENDVDIKQPSVQQQIALSRENAEKYLSAAEYARWTEHTARYAELTTAIASRNVMVDSVNAAQNARKVMMNTFYGILGSDTNSLYRPEIAGSVTAEGQKIWQIMFKKLVEAGATPIYGDTDSVYVTPNAAIYRALDVLYYAGLISKLEYWTRIVERTFVEIKWYTQIINKAFREYTTNDMIRVAYEEVLWPAKYSRKKKYGGIAHIKNINFKPDQLFTRGYDMYKRNASPLLMKYGEKVLWSMFSIDNISTPLEITCDVIRELFTNNEISLDDFTLTATYRPDKNNVPVQTFVKRMSEFGKQPKPGERFDYIIVERSRNIYAINGKRTELKKGDCMEYKTTVVEQGLRPNLSEYFESQICGQLAVFIAPYIVAPEDAAINSAITDDERVKLAREYLEDYITQFYTKEKKLTNRYKKAYNRIVKHITENIEYTAGVSSEYLEQTTASKRYKEKMNAVERGVAVVCDVARIDEISEQNKTLVKRIVRNVVQYTEMNCANVEVDQIAHNFYKTIMNNDAACAQYRGAHNGTNTTILNAFHDAFAAIIHDIETDIDNIAKFVEQKEKIICETINQMRENVSTERETDVLNAMCTKFNELNAENAAFSQHLNNIIAQFYTTYNNLRVTKAVSRLIALSVELPNYRVDI